MPGALGQQGDIGKGGPFESSSSFGRENSGNGAFFGNEKTTPDWVKKEEDISKTKTFISDQMPEVQVKQGSSNREDSFESLDFQEGNLANVNKRIGTKPPPTERPCHRD